MWESDRHAITGTIHQLKEFLKFEDFAKTSIALSPVHYECLSVQRFFLLAFSLIHVPRCDGRGASVFGRF